MRSAESGLGTGGESFHTIDLKGCRNEVRKCSLYANFISYMYNSSRLFIKANSKYIAFVYIKQDFYELIENL